MQLFNGLNDAVIQAARRAGTPRFQVSDTAPQSVSEMYKAFSETGSIVVWSGGSESTIYREPQVNYLFRAWHDWTHLKTGSDFSLAGETRNAMAQMSQVGTELQRLIYIEAVLQATCYFQTGNFPVDQVAFTLEALKNKSVQALKF
jgi:hypothetical protein